MKKKTFKFTDEEMIYLDDILSCYFHYVRILQFSGLVVTKETLERFGFAQILSSKLYRDKLPF